MLRWKEYYKLRQDGFTNSELQDVADAKTHRGKWTNIETEGWQNVRDKRKQEVAEIKEMQYGYVLKQAEIDEKVDDRYEGFDIRGKHYDDFWDWFREGSPDKAFPHGVIKSKGDVTAQKARYTAKQKEKKAKATGTVRDWIRAIDAHLKTATGARREQLLDQRAAWEAKA